MNTDVDHLFEASWEVCNRVGGIYTVVKSKTTAMTQYYDNYVLIGPYNEDEAKSDFEPDTPPDWLDHAFDTVDGTFHYGDWIAADDNTTILIEPGNVDRDAVKEELWNEYGVDSLNAGVEFDETLAWSWTVAELIRTVADDIDDTVLLHCHEWLSGFALLNVEEDNAVDTAFTTHATILGRTLASAGRDLYDELDSINAEEEAKQLGIEAKHTTEKAAAHAADVFTTVSEITAIEAEALLDREVDVILNNGMDTDEFPTIEETTMMHVKNRDIVREFLMYHFFPHYSFELEHNLIYYLVGRFEYKNKGIDVYIDALARLNQRLQDEDTQRTITAFFFVPMETRGIRDDVEEKRGYYRHIKNVLERNEDDIIDKLLMDLMCQRCTMEESIFASDYLQTVQRNVELFQRDDKPSIATHYLANDDNPVMQRLREHGLDNAEENKVKVIVYPVYLDGDDNLLNLPYYEALSAGHLGVFPSHYEPWGYTPVEAMSLGVPAVTTDVAGFGRFIQDKTLDEKPGVYIQERFQQSRDDVVEGIYKKMYDFAMNDHAERVQNKINAKQMSHLVDWKHFAKNYVDAHNHAVQE